jgi:hypothetical protein
MDIFGPNRNPRVQTITVGSTEFTEAELSAGSGGVIDLSADGYDAYIKFKDLELGDTASWYFGAKGFTYSGVENHTLGLAYNFNPGDPANRVNTAQPAFSWNWEPNYKDGAGGQGLLEHNWSYTSIDGSVGYRPFAFSLNLTTHNAEWDWTGTRMVFRHRANDIDATKDALRIVPDGTAGGTTSINGALRITGLAALSGGPILIDGASEEALIQVSPNSFANQQSVINISFPTATYSDFIYAFVAQGTVNTGNLQTGLINNSSSGGVLAYMAASHASATGDVKVMMQSGSSVLWSFGIDASDSRKFKVSRSSALGTSDTVSIGASDITLGVKSVLAATSTSAASLNIPIGSAPSSPVDGDIWREDNTDTGLKIRVNGVTKTITLS